MVLNQIELAAAATNKELIVIIRPEGGFEIDWQATERQLAGGEHTLQEKLHTSFMNNPGEFLLLLGFSESSMSMSESLGYLRLISSAFVKKLSRNPDIESLRERTEADLEEEEMNDFLQNAPYLGGAEHLNLSWIEKVWENLNASFSNAIQIYKGSAEQFFASMNPNIHLVGRVFFHLVESKNEGYPFSFLATYSSGVSKDGHSRHLPLKNALIEFEENNRKLLELLSTVHKAADKSAFIAELVESGEIFHPIGLTAAEAYTFLKEVLLYEEAGILCRIPKWWRSKTDSVKLSVRVGDKQPSRLNFDALVDFHAELFLGGQPLPVSELKQLLAEAEGLVFIKGKWVEVNHERLKEALKAYEQAQKLMGKSDINIKDALRFQLHAGDMLKVSEEACELEITNGEWLRSVVGRLTQPETIEPVAAGEDFHASLRAYQERGVSWLHYMKSLGLGACLADDMGLGKTVQVIALLNDLRTKKRERTLLIVPASLIGNWVSEIAKFAPSLRCFVCHPSENKNIEDNDISLEEHDLVITTYGMLLKYDWLACATWDIVILDEAQAIKNPGSKQTRTVKQVKAAFKIAMTGTPIENRLADLWSLFDFLNQGLLGTAKEFTDFTKRIRESRDGYARLKQAVSPFVLRRLKTDKTIISDLPDKIEMKTYSTLTKKQAVLYNKLVDDLKTKIESAEDGIQRKGLVLSSLMKFKQICNHPDQYLGQHDYAEEESGKYARLREICETIYEKRERVLVFTQFKEITASLQAFLERIFQHKGLVLHGETAVGKRKEIVAAFQGQEYVPFMVLSIKAGGVGLNLTSANHVIHFDRWWNPAVENQATDRAFRIGQKKNVVVHKFIARGTIEEKIDLIIEDKTKLSKEIIPDIQENWIMEMDNKQLMDLFRLSL